jgi:hypothetical protein
VRVGQDVLAADLEQESRVAYPGDAQLISARRWITNVGLRFGKSRWGRPRRKRVAQPLELPAEKLVESSFTVTGRPGIAKPAARNVMLLQKKARRAR